MIEHTPDDRATLRELRRVCKPGGFLLVTVPAYQAPVVDARRGQPPLPPVFARVGLRAAAGEAGWRVRRMTSFNGLLLAPAAAVRLAERRRLRQPNCDYKPELTLGPEWLNAALEQPLRSRRGGWRAGGACRPGCRCSPCSRTREVGRLSGVEG